MTPYKIWYDSPAFEDYYKGLPLGNGKIGGMIYGSPEKDIIHINEGTIWTGSPYHNNIENAHTNLRALQNNQLLNNPNQDRDWEIAFIKGKHGENTLHGQTFQYAGQVVMSFNHRNFDNFKRELDLSKAIITTSYNISHTKYTKEYFANYPSNVLACKISSSSNNLNFSLSFVSDMNGKVTTPSEDTLLYEGITDGRKGIEGKLKFAVVIKALPIGGKVSISTDTLKIENADSCHILITVATNFVNYKTLGNDYIAQALKTINTAKNKGYDILRKEHIKDYKSIFNKVDINLGNENTNSPTDKRLEEFKDNEDPSLVGLFYQYNRYLMISSSRVGGQPANLQGIWNNLKFPPWDSKYTTNINFQMNYWPAFIANLQECSIPFTEKVNQLKEPGSDTAKELYNISKGWVLHHNTDLWNITGPVDGPWGLTPTCGAWLANQLFDQYLYQMDRNYLEEIYGTLKGAAEFILSFLTEFESYLVPCPSTSPEIQQKGQKPKYISYASAFDLQIIHQLFENIINACCLLERDKDFINQIEDAKDKLPSGVNIGRWGQVQEFYFQDYDDINETHRHISNLVGVYPLTVVDVKNERIKKAVETTLEARTKPGDWTGWGIAWRIGQYARLGDGVNAYNMMKLVLDPKNRLIYPNLFGAHPIGDKDKVFQIDGNFGALAGISSAYEEIHLLPALPTKWSWGKVSGLCARGGFTIQELQWKDCTLEKVTLFSLAGGILNLRFMDKSISIDTEPGKTYTFNEDLNLVYQNI